MRICLVSDFFYPNHGGVEEHIYSLAQCLISNKNKVIIVTHSYGDRKGIRHMTNGLKVYYLPILVFYNQCILPTMVANIKLLRDIFIREEIQIVHGHSAFSAIAFEAMTVGVLMGLRAVFTDHSLFGFADLSAIVTNKHLQVQLAFCSHFICVSHCGKANTHLRGKMPAEKISVIPNAVNTVQFSPNPIKRDKKMITILIVSRLVYRKGIDLLAGIIPHFRERHDVNFIIAGDGPKRELLEEIREKNNMQDRVQLLGALAHSEVRDVLTKGHIFLNTSLTEAFCMAITEACSTGLHVVSTRVGGVPEVLPEYLNVILAEPETKSLIDALEKTIDRVKRFRAGKSRPDEITCPFRINKILSQLYSWQDVSRRTECVYRKVLEEPHRDLKTVMTSVLERSGVYLYLLVISLCYIIIKFYDFIYPADEVVKCRDYNEMKRRKFERNIPL